MLKSVFCQIGADGRELVVSLNCNDLLELFAATGAQVLDSRCSVGSSECASGRPG